LGRQGFSVSMIDEVLAEFRNAAIEKADFAKPARRDSDLHDRMKNALIRLREAGDSGDAAFRRLLEDESPHVRSWVAAELLSRGELTAVAVLERLSREPGSIGFDARTTLNEHEAGRLRSPFGLLPIPPLQTDGALRRR